MRRNARRKEAFLQRKSEALKKSDNNLEVETSSQVKIFLCDQCDQLLKTKNGLRIHVGRSHKDNIPQLDGQNEDITADLVLQTCPIKKPEAIKSKTQTDSPCDCMKYCGETFENKIEWKIHMLKEHMDDIKILSNRHSRFLQQALENKRSRHYQILGYFQRTNIRLIVLRRCSGLKYRPQNLHHLHCSAGYTPDLLFSI